jgi:hypothetical protein
MARATARRLSADRARAECCAAKRSAKDDLRRDGLPILTLPGEVVVRDRSVQLGPSFIAS